MRECVEWKILADVTDTAAEKQQKTKEIIFRKKETIKTEIVIEENGRIMSISRSHRGRIHDFWIRKQEKFLPQNSVKYADSGYQWWQKIQGNVIIPYKKYRKKPLTPEQKEHNRKLSSFRMRVEHKIREIKIFNHTFIVIFK